MSFIFSLLSVWLYYINLSLWCSNQHCIILQPFFCCPSVLSFILRLKLKSWCGIQPHWFYLWKTLRWPLQYSASNSWLQSFLSKPWSGQHNQHNWDGHYNIDLCKPWSGQCIRVVWSSSEVGREEEEPDELTFLKHNYFHLDLHEHHHCHHHRHHYHHQHNHQHHHPHDNVKKHLLAGKERFRGEAWFERGECGEPRWLNINIIIIIIIAIIIIIII